MLSRIYNSALMLNRPWFRSSPRLASLISVRNLFIQTQTTPNESALKFVPSMQILQPEQTMEFLSGREAYKSPLALKLFSVDGIKSVMLGPDFITIEKHSDFEHEWSLLKPEIFAILTEFLTSGEPIVSEGYEQPLDTAIDEDDDEVVSMVKELIFTRIRPAIQDDGGDIEFVKFDEDTGTVYLRLRGACRSCDSSSITLKNGIESMLKHYIEEVENVEQIDEAEEEDLEDPLVEAKRRRLEQQQQQQQQLRLMNDDVPPVL